MAGKPVVPREQAVRDVEAIIDDYLSASAAQAALGFIDALESAYAHIGAHPATGSARYAFELDMPGLRVWRVARYPHLLFYVEREDRIDLWRILHGKRDVAQWLREPPDDEDI